MGPEFSAVTELAGDDVSPEQIERNCHRYVWASNHCHDRDVIEVACGTGQGLGLLMKVARSVRAGDYDEKIQAKAQEVYGERIVIDQVDAQDLPYEDDSANVVILFEAMYYLPAPDRFVEECKRVLRPGGSVLIANSNKDLSDFHPSPFSHTYHGTVELRRLFEQHGFTVALFGYFSCQTRGFRQWLLKTAKIIASRCGLIPRTMAGKKILKRLVFGRLAAMPDELSVEDCPYVEPISVSADVPDKEHKVIYCIATLGG
ncbi:MAG: class I SAM-dependent methyltransferase [Fuerstiella sp.]|nr:class I SAM-dependent methyltransferase [Fuerstiella sp.]